MLQRLLLTVRNIFKRPATGGTVRYMFPALLTSVAAYSFFALSGATAGSTIILESDRQTIEAGSAFEVVIYADVAVPVNALDISIEFPEDKLEVLGVDRGQSVLTIWTTDPEITQEQVTLSGGTFNRGFLGKHQIATIDFRALETGQYEIEATNITFVAGDGEGTVIPPLQTDGMTLSLFNFDDTMLENEVILTIETVTETDVNEDGRITLQDISAFMGAWSGGGRHMDFNNDGDMTFKDFSIILADFFSS